MIWGIGSVPYCHFYEGDTFKKRSRASPFSRSGLEILILFFDTEIVGIPSFAEMQELASARFSRRQGIDFTRALSADSTVKDKAKKSLFLLIWSVFSISTRHLQIQIWGALGKLPWTFRENKFQNFGQDDMLPSLTNWNGLISLFRKKVWTPTRFFCNKMGNTH